MPVGASIAKLTATRAYGADVELVGRVAGRRAGGGPRVRRPDRRGAGAPVRPPGRAPRPGHRRTGDPRAGAGRGHRRGRGRRRRADQRGRRRAAGAAARGADRRGAGRTGRRLAGVAARRSAGPAARDVHPGRRDRRRRTVGADLRARQRAGRRDRHGLRGSAVAGDAAVPGTREAGGRAGRGRRGGGDHGATRRCSPRRWSPCCPAGTSTRWCCCTSPSTGWWPPGGSCRCESRSSTGPGRWRRCSRWSGELGGNVVDVEHSRVGSSLPLGDVEVALRLETRGAPHCDEIVGR